MAFNKNEARPAYDVNILTEYILRENAYFKIYNVFTPNPRRATLTEKFYVQHENFSTADPTFLDIIKDYKDRMPVEKYPAPVKESHLYGWFSRPLVPLRKWDRRYFHGVSGPISRSYIPKSKR